MVADVRLNTWTPLEAPWDTPMSQDEQEAFAASAVISGATSESAIVALFSDTPQLYVNSQRLGSA